MRSDAQKAGASQGQLVSAIAPLIAGASPFWSHGLQNPDLREISRQRSSNTGEVTFSIQATSPCLWHGTTSGEPSHLTFGSRRMDQDAGVISEYPKSPPSSIHTPASG